MSTINNSGYSSVDNKGYATGGQGFGDWIGGTGNIDWGRELYTMNFNAQEAEKARNFSAYQDQLSRDWSSEEASRNRVWQEHMSNTAYQRAVEDMRTAGLNPYLAYNQGGATTPSGSVGSAPAHSAVSASHSHTGKARHGFMDSVLAIAGKIAGIAVHSAFMSSVLQPSKTLAKITSSRIKSFIDP